MKKTVKNYIQTVTGCTVDMGKTYYSKVGRSNSRTIKIFDLRNKEVLPEIQQVLTFGELGVETQVLTEDNVTYIKVIFPGHVSWEDIATNIVDNAVAWEMLDPSAEEPVEDTTASVPDPELPEASYEAAEPQDKVEVVISTLHVGMNITPIGMAYASDEADLENLKTFLRGMLAVSHIFR